MKQPWVVYTKQNRRLVYVGLHTNETECWQIFLGWPSEEEIKIVKKDFEASMATVTLAGKVIRP